MAKLTPVMAGRGDDSEARRMGAYIHGLWPFIPEQGAYEFYWGLGHTGPAEGAAKLSLWVLKQVLEHENPAKHKVGDVWDHLVGDGELDLIYAPMTVVKVNEDGSLRMSDDLDWEEDELEDGWRKRS